MPSVLEPETFKLFLWIQLPFICQWLLFKLRISDYLFRPNYLKKKRYYYSEIMMYSRIELRLAVQPRSLHGEWESLQEYSPINHFSIALCSSTLILSLSLSLPPSSPSLFLYPSLLPLMEIYLSLSLISFSLYVIFKR
jgi:hypothetical protein